MSRGYKDIDLFLVNTAVGSQKMLTLAAGPGLSMLGVNRLGIAIF